MDFSAKSFRKIPFLSRNRLLSAEIGIIFVLLRCCLKAIFEHDKVQIP